MVTRYMTSLMYHHVFLFTYTYLECSVSRYDIISLIFSQEVLRNWYAKKREILVTCDDLVKNAHECRDAFIKGK